MERPDRVLERGPFRLEERQSEIDHLGVEAGPVRLDVRRRTQSSEARNVGGIDDLEVILRG